jgi:hypothetical protein
MDVQEKHQGGGKTNTAEIKTTAEKKPDTIQEEETA